MKFSLRVQGSSNWLTNYELLPLAPERRTWGWTSYVSFWISDAVNLSSAVIVASAVVSGLNWWQAWISTLLAYTIASWGIVLMSKAGATYHVGFPPIARVAFGVFGGMWPVFNRVVTSTLWFAFQSALGGGCATLVLRALIPQYNDIPNTLSESAGITSRDLLSLIIFWLTCIPGVLTRPEKLKYLFMAKSILTPIGFFALLGWSVSQAGGLGPIVSVPAKLEGSALGWAFVAAITSQLSNMVTLLVNCADFARLAKKQSDVVAPQLIAMPGSFALTSLIGLWIASSSQVIFNTEVFNPLDILVLRLNQDPFNATTRVGCFFIGACFWIGQIGTNIAANSLSAGSDGAALLPRYIDIRRGGFICACLALIVQPWRLVQSDSFATYLGSYSVLLSPFLGIMLSDYYVIRRGLLNVPHMYTTERGTDYMYGSYGVNWRSVVAYICGLAINMPGFIGAGTGSFANEGVQHIFQLAFFVGLGVSSFVYLLCCWVSLPQGGVPFGEKGWYEPKGGFEDPKWLASIPIDTKEESEAVGEKI
ncbi:hypothetical protein HDU93_000849 [Gonapodya sp. JEL0774]|nr:hypothetical protein HDU93_000849 [Gonapodya sp. JEL0774]